MGSAPGAAGATSRAGDAVMGHVQTRMYRAGVLEAEGFAVSEVSERLATPDALVWVDLCAPDAAQLHELADELGLHELAVEDVLEPHQRPKLDHYATHRFLACHAVVVDPDRATLQLREVNAFVNPQWLITVRVDDGFPMDAVIDRWDRSPDLAAEGVSFLVYGLLDVVVDGYFDAVQAFDDYYDDISEGLFSERPLAPSQQRDWFNMRRALVRFHRLVVPLRETLSALMRREHHAVSAELYPYYQDVYDHILRVNESTDALRDLVSTIVETNLSLRDFRQNQIMKKVTSWAAIIAVPTLVTGYYGMNVPYPGAQQPSGALVSTGLMVALSATLYVLFRWRDWL
jgi:magnesium transporter